MLIFAKSFAAGASFCAQLFLLLLLGSPAVASAGQHSDGARRRHSARARLNERPNGYWSVGYYPNYGEVHSS